MGESIRINTQLGINKTITVNLEQDFNFLEILSIKIQQENVYTRSCSNYGVIVGRVTANNGFGIPNARVSIFVPLSSDDENDPVISALYPYKSTTQRSDANYRYNLLPARKQHGGHEPTGTFPDQSDILSREEVLEVYEKYYNFDNFYISNDKKEFKKW